MIIEVKDLPEGQKIDKIDIHIDFQKGLATTVATSSPHNKIPDVEYVLLNNTQGTQSANETPEVPNEMLNAEF